MKQIYTTTLRLNLADEDDRRAYEHLQQMNKKQYRSYGRNGLKMTRIWKPVKKRMLFFGV